MIIEVYKDEYKNIWDDFVCSSKNGTFHLLRDFLEYHRERFQDHSLLIRNQNHDLIALLPANQAGNLLSSHAGLSYGGFITGTDMTAAAMLEVFESVLLYYKSCSIDRMLYKCIPYIYHRLPAEEDRYALFLAGAILSRRDVVAVIPQMNRLSFTARRKRGFAKAQKKGVHVSECRDYQAYWAILSEVLACRHNTKPTHNLQEIELLSSRFPNNIRLFCCWRDDIMLGGTVIYESERVAHCQYQAASDEGKRLGALDLIYDYLINDLYRNKPYFDFGNSNEANGRRLNQGLNYQKEGFGARAVAQDFYEINVSNIRVGDLTGAII